METPPSTRMAATAYAASPRRLTPRAKVGTIGLTQVLAAELGPKGTRVNAISPGGTDTRLARTMISTRKRSPEGVHALKRLDEIARSVLYLATDASSFTSAVPGIPAV
jgi:NAD(P)-dependent dehydrogenase (short-subunit alcohol dehydrogenase family)